MTKRRTFVKSMAGALPASMFLSSPASRESVRANLPPSPESAVERDYLKELGVQPVINAGLPYSRLSGSWLWPEVITAMNYMTTRLVRMDDLHDAVGKRIASLVGCESAMVSAGAASAITLGTAACMTGTDEELIRSLPDTQDMKNEVIILKEHRYEYEQSVRTAGAKLIQAATSADLVAAINNRTAMMLFYYGREPKGKINAKDFIAIGKKHKVAVFIDGATTDPPYETLSTLMALGCDLACFSGGKGLRGPYGAGLLLGRKDLIAAARLNGPPNDATIGRGMKVGREEMLGMMVAVEVALKHDYLAEVRTGKQWMRQIADQVSSIPGMKPEIFLPEYADRMPRMRLSRDETKVKIAPRELITRLRNGDPSIEVVSWGHAEGTFQISSWVLRPDEVAIVGRRIREELEKAWRS
jgi:D-glucosaminate-6-phosphate ammonia-lyase